MRLTCFSITALCLLLSACSCKSAAPPLGGAAKAETAEQARAQAGKSAGFERTLELQGISFKVTCANDSSLNQLRVVPSGLEIINDPISREVEGTVTGAEVADLNADGSPELYVYIQSAGSGSYATLVAYSANKRKSLSEIHLPPVSENAAASQGYMGHDEFRVVERTFVQRFPIYVQGSSNARPSGKIRQLEYKLVQGEASWRLRLSKAIEY